MGKLRSVVPEKWNHETKKDIDSLGISLDTLMLSSDSREVAVHNIAGFTANKFLKKIKCSFCCKMHITGSIDMENPGHEYLIILNRGSFTIPFPNLENYVCNIFAALNTTENVRQMISRNAAKKLFHI